MSAQVPYRTTSGQHCTHVVQSLKTLSKNVRTTREKLSGHADPKTGGQRQGSRSERASNRPAVYELQAGQLVRLFPDNLSGADRTDNPPSLEGVSVRCPVSGPEGVTGPEGVKANDASAHQAALAHEHTDRRTLEGRTR